MQAPNWSDFLQCSVCTNKYDSTQVVPVSLSCGHTLCTKCLGKLKTRVCPYDKTAISPNTEILPPNTALLLLLGQKPSSGNSNKELSFLNLSEGEQEQYEASQEAIEELALFLQPLAEQGLSSAVSHLTRPMLKKLVTVVNCQVLEIEGRARALRAARSIADRTVTELLVLHQNQQQISTLLWTAVKNRGCQFLGPVMQEEALKLILKVLESGNLLCRKNIVLYVVQQLQHDFPQATKTSVGHVVQLLYRASCFNVEKMKDQSSLMQLKEEFRAYESLRREHDSQIIRVAMEAGLRISPEQWSTLLYGDHKHKSDMQSIIDRLIAQGAASSGLSELIVAIGRSQDPWDLSEKIVPHLEVLLKVDINVDKNSELVASWQMFAESMKALLATLQGFTTFMQIQSGRYKTGMCPSLGKSGGCPKGEKCTYAHSEEERDRYRSIARGSKKPPVLSGKPLPSGPTFSGKGIPAPTGSQSKPYRTQSGEIGTVNVEGTSYFEGSVYGNRTASYPTGIRDAYPGSEHYDPSAAPPLRYPSYAPADGSQPIVIQSVVDPAQIPLTRGGKVYSGPQAPLVGYTTDPRPGHHSGPIAVHDVFEGGRHVATDIQYYSRRSGPLAEEVTYAHTTPYPYKAPQYSPQNSVDVSYVRVEEGNPHYNLPPVPAVPTGARMTPSSMPDSLADLRRMRETVKKSLQSQSSGPTFNGGEEGRVVILGSGYDGRMDGTIPNRASLSSISSLPDNPRYVDATGQPVRPPSSHQPRPSDSTPLSHGDAVVTTTSPLPLSSPEDADRYPTSSSVGNYSYVSSASSAEPEVVSKGVSYEPRGAGSTVSYNLENRMSELSVSGGGRFDPSYSTSADIPGSVYGSSTSGHHSVPPSASYSTSSISGPEYRQSAAGRNGSSNISGSVMTTTAAGRGSSEEDQLREQVRQLRQQLSEKQATIAELQQPVYAGASRGAAHHTSPGHSAMLGYAGEQQASRHSGPIPHHPTYGGPVQVPVHYSPHNTAPQYYTHTHIQSGGGPYYTAPQPSPAGAYHNQWSGPLNGNYSGPLGTAGISPPDSLQAGASLPTPPGTGLIVHPPAGGYVVQQQAPPVPLDSDAHLAHWLQVMEQQKATQQYSNPGAMSYSHPERFVPVAATAYTLEPAPPSFVYKYAY